jgi:hypothetical protein
MRREERQSVNRTASVDIGDGKVLQCRIANISRGGALLMLPDVDDLPNVFRLLDTHSKTRREVRKVWTGPNRVGVEYIDGDAEHFGKPVTTQVAFGKRPNNV